MQNSTNMRILELLRFLYERTDENHPATVSDIIAHLNGKGIQAVRQTVYADTNALIDAGIDIVVVKSTQNQYFMGNRLFEYPELKMLTDAVASSKIISAKKSEELVQKLCRLTSLHQAKQLQKTSMSVPEMGKMLGLGKVESYWLVKKNYFKTIQVGGRIRVMLDSFEDWYAGQFHYKKVDGTPPGEKWRHTTMSVPEMADLLGLKSGTAYDLVKRGYFETTLIDRRIRIITSSFEAWYQKQTHYVKISERSNENGIYREA